MYKLYIPLSSDTMTNKLPLDEYLTLDEYKKKESNIDKLSAIAYSLVIGSILDWRSGLNTVGVLASRG